MFLGGCDVIAPPEGDGNVIATQPPVPSTTAQPALRASPTPEDPRAVRKGAALAYLAAAKRSHNADRNVPTKYKTFPTIERAYAYLMQAADDDARFVEDLKKIAVPDDIQSDFEDLIQKTAALAELERQVSTARTWPEANPIISEWRRQANRASVAANRVRSGLGLPLVHVKGSNAES
jgi:hypothetical protein